MGTMTIIKVDGSIEVTKDLRVCPGIQTLQKGVGGLIETVPYFNKYEGEPCVAYCNEEGKIVGLDYNKVASELWYKQVPMARDMLVGDVVILQGDAAFMRSI